jgi:hypothetical protein
VQSLVPAWGETYHCHSLGDHVKRTGKPLVDDEIVDCSGGLFFDLELAQVVLCMTQSAVSLPLVPALGHSIIPRRLTSSKSWALDMFPSFAATDGMDRVR